MNYQETLDMVLYQNDAAEWIYRNEGAANLVLAYTGSHPVFVGKVMRIPKVPRNENALANRNAAFLTEHEKLLWRDHEELLSSPNKEFLEQSFVRHVIAPLLGAEYVDSGTRVQVSREFLESVEKNVRSQRPKSRVDAATVDTHRDSVILLSDHSLFNQSVSRGKSCISVEIKPKWGFLPLSEHIAETNAIKRTTSRFRMHQMLKLHKNEVSELSEYNPLDLFSGSKDRIFKAINGLYTTPQNNFRVFLNGSRIFGGSGCGVSGTSSVAAKELEDVLKTVIQAGEGQCTNKFLQLVSEVVYSSKILDRLLVAQKLDASDIEGAIHVYYNVISEPCTICKKAGNEVSKRYATLHSMPLSQSLKIVKEFLISATAKDCSLMITFTLKEDEKSVSSCNTVYLDSTNQTFDYKIHFIDLDLKPLRKMEDYYKLDQKIVGYYNETEKRA